MAWIFNVIESRNGVGWKGPQTSPRSHPLPWARNTLHRPGCSKPHPNLALDTSREKSSLLCLLQSLPSFQQDKLTVLKTSQQNDSSIRLQWPVREGSHSPTKRKRGSGGHTHSLLLHSSNSSQFSAIKLSWCFFLLIKSFFPSIFPAAEHI